VSLLPLADARARVLAGCPPLDPTVVDLADALGLVTTVSLSADDPVPPFANTAMDGFAVRADDTATPPTRLAVVGTVAAGAVGDIEVGPGQAVCIMTGAPIPPGADAVVMVERTATEDDGAIVIVHHRAEPGDHIRVAGEDLAAGQEVFPAGTVLHAGHLGVLASMGLVKVPVTKRPTVGVLSTGDELVLAPTPLRPGQIRDSNRTALLAMVRLAGCTPVDLGLAPDNEGAIEDALRRGLEACDAIVTTGGVSVGDFDFVKVVLDRLSGATMSWMQVAIRPAKPLAFGVVDGVAVFGLPGNPVSCLVSFELFARPALRQMMGQPVLDRPRVWAVADEGLARRPDGKLHLVRVHVRYGEEGRYHVVSSGGQGSHLLRAMALANALALLPDGDGAAAGADVEVMLLAYPEG